MTPLIPAIFWLSAALAGASGPGPSQPSCGHGANVSVAVPPTATNIGGVHYLTYELRLANIDPNAATVKRVIIRNDDTGTVLADYSEDALLDRLAPLDRLELGSTADHATPPVNVQTLSAIVYVDVPLKHGPIPTVVSHEIEFADAGTAAICRILLRTIVDGTPPIVLDAPLRGGFWIAVYDPMWPRGHRRVTYGESNHIPGRHAIDWVKVDALGKTMQGDPDTPANALGYAAEVLAVADGMVVAARDDMSEVTSIASNGPHGDGDEGGNFVAIDLSGGRYAFYEHLKPGSIKVHPGERVRRGDVIGALGFTGDATLPHLHFHIADRNSPLGAEGIPFVFRQFELLGWQHDLGKLGLHGWSRNKDRSSLRKNERPAPGAVLRFMDLSTGRQVGRFRLAFPPDGDQPSADKAQKESNSSRSPAL